MKFYSPLTADFFPNDTEDLDDDYSEYEGIPYTGKELTGYRDVIRDAIYEDVKDFYGDLMRYYREDDSVRRKVVRAVPTVNEVNGEFGESDGKRIPEKGFFIKNILYNNVRA